MELRTDRLRLREFSFEDEGRLLPFARKPEQLRYMLFSLADESEIASFLAHAIAQIAAEPRLEYHLALEDAADSSFVGSVALMIEPDSPSSAELGYWLHESRWGRGYAAEASRAIIEYGFSALGLHRIWGKCHVDNSGSARVMEKCGMTFEGTIREHVWLRDHFRSSRLYSILISDPRGR